MSFLTVEELVEARRKNPNLPIHSYYTSLPHGPITPVQAQALLDDVKRATKACRHGKNNRPWSLVNLTEKLDPEQPWFGFELECGWDDAGSYSNVVDYVMDHLVHVVIDREGNSAYPSEITFSPQNYNDFIDGSAAILQFYDWLGGDGPEMAHPDSYCGTHLNISTPAFRRARNDVRARQNIAGALNYGILAMTKAGLHEVFGRTPYGLGHCRQGNSGAVPWIEFKVFQSVATKDRFLKHLEVSKNMAAILEKLSAEYTLEWAKKINRVVDPNDPYSAKNPNQEVIYNLEEILLGKETEPKYINVVPMFSVGLGSLAYGSGDLIRQYIADQVNKKAA